MSDSINGHLAYGYDLGDPTDLPGGSRYDIDLDGYYPNDSTDWPTDGFYSAALRALYDSVPALDPYESVVEHEQIIADLLGVRLFDDGTSEASMYVLATVVFTGDHTSTLQVAPAVLATDTTRWNEQLAHALSVLGLTPHQPQPAWLLTANAN